MKKYWLEMIVFTTGACVMIMELVGSRVMAPHLGTSIVVWTSLIGLILGFMSLGYAWGGRLADKNPSLAHFSRIIFLAGVFVGVVGIIKTPFLTSLEATVPDIRMGAIIATIALFAIPSTLLGMVSPYAVKLKMQTLTTTGATVGSLYAISTTGSIVGTFLTGFWLLSWLGNTMLLFLVALILIMTAVFADRKTDRWFKLASIIFFIGAMLAEPYSAKAAAKRGLVDIDTAYARILVVNTFDPQTRRAIRGIVTDSRGMQSAIFLDDPTELVFDYAKYYRLARHFVPDIRRGLVIGGAGYTYPRDFLRTYPDATVDVVEIDPGMTKIAQEYFSLTPDPRLAIYHQDGRTFLNASRDTYDAIFGDAFHSVFSVPYELTTEEAITSMYDRLSDNGVVILNLISSLEGRRSLFLQAEYHTFRAVFPHVLVFPVNGSKAPEEVQNIILVASKSPTLPALQSTDREIQSYLDTQWTKDIPSTLPILTDNFAPVDQYMIEAML